jgi:hypothetical protein
MTFKKGVSGNPKGRAKGIKQKVPTAEEIAMQAAKDACKAVKWARAVLKDPKFSFDEHVEAAQILTDYAAKILPPKQPKPSPMASVPAPPASDPAPVEEQETPKAPISAEVERPPQPKPLQPTEIAALNQPRIHGEDSHTCVVGPDGKVTYHPKHQPPKPLTHAQVCEAAGASDPRRFRR